MINQLFVYSLKACLTLALLYAPYTLLLQREKFFRLNRLMLLMILLMSLTLPLCNISPLSLDDTPVVQAMQQQMAGAGIPIHTVVLPGVEVKAQRQATAELSWFGILAILYLAGVVAVLLTRAVQMGMLSYMLRRHSLWTRQQSDGTRICCMEGNFSPYSWMNTIVINPSDWTDSHHEILLHETGHIRALHSYDMLLLMLCQAMQWYNPFVWMLGNSLSDLHEYEADEYVLAHGIEARGYQMLLIKKAAGASSYTFANSFNHSLTKKRITMMQKSNSNPWRRSRALYVLPVAALALSAFATSPLTSPTEAAVRELADKSTQNSALVQTSLQENAISRPEGKKNEEPVLDKCEVLPQYGKDATELYGFLAKSMRYPQEAQEVGAAGRIIVRFVVEKDGTISDTEIIRTLEEPKKGNEAEEVKNSGVTVVTYQQNEDDAQVDLQKWNAGKKALENEALRVVKLTSGQWTPGQDKGKKVRVRFVLPITFRLN